MEEAEHWPKGLDPSDYSPERAVKRAADSGAICVKAFVESGFGIFHWPYLHTATLRQIRDAATARKLVLLVHATSVDSWRSAIDAKTDVIEHGLWIWPGDAAASRRSAEGLKSRNALLDEYRKASPAPGFEVLLPAVIARTRATFKIMLQERVPVLFGSDTPAGDGFGNPPGLNGRLELQE